MPEPPSGHLFLIRAASLLVPRYARGEWLREWEAELWHVHATLADRGEEGQLWQFSRGALADAALYRINRLDGEAVLRGRQSRTRSPGFCLASLASAIVVLALASGLLPVTRSLLLPLAYDDAGRVATVARASVAGSVRTGVPESWVLLWQHKSRLLTGVASYVWSENDGILDARVSDNFFAVVGVRAAQGRLFERGDAVACDDCVVLSHDYAARRRLEPGGTLVLDGRRRRVIGVLDSRFWFLSRRIGVWSPVSSQERAADARTAAVVRLAPGIGSRAAAAELESILQNSGLPAWDSLVEIGPLQERVRSVFGSFALALALATVIVILALRVRLPALTRDNAGGALFFLAKSTLLLAIVLVIGLEFTHAPSITMTGGTDMLTEPLSTWLFLIACMGALTWAIQDQRRRCRVCLRRLGMAAQVGCPGCLLLDFACTELVCNEGHGMLHIPEMPSCWRDAEEWTALDESWVDLFAR